MTEKIRSQFLSNLLGETFGKTFAELLRSGGKEGAAAVVERMKEIIKTNPRADLLYILLALPQDQADTLWLRHRLAIRQGQENSFVRALGEAIPKKTDGSVDMDRAKTVFGELAKMDEQRFDQVVEELKHDPIMEHVRFFFQHSGDFLNTFSAFAGKACGVLVNGAEQLDEGAGRLAERMNERLEEKNRTVFGRLANWLIK